MTGVTQSTVSGMSFSWNSFAQVLIDFLKDQPPIKKNQVLSSKKGTMKSLGVLIQCVGGFFVLTLLLKEASSCNKTQDQAPHAHSLDLLQVQLHYSP
jgi:hypothetical protein